MRGERKKYQLAAASRPGPEKGLSTTVAVLEDGQGYCYVRFSDALVEAVGKALPRGVSEVFPAFLQAERDEKGWKVYARYQAKSMPSSPILLWETAERPSWLQFIKVRGKQK